MTILTTNKPNWIIAIGIPIFIFLGCFFITLTSKFKTNIELLSNTILIDMLVVAPLIYFLAIRKSSISKWTVSRIFIIGLLIAGFILNAHSNIFLQIIKTWVSPIIEGIIIFFIGSKFYVANKKAKETNSNKIDFLRHCRTVIFEVMKNEKLANIISSEIAVLYYAIFSSEDKTIDNIAKFTSHKENGVTTILRAILFIFVIETAIMHLLINLWSRSTAWALTGLRFYTCIQLFAHLKAIKARPITINKC